MDAHIVGGMVSYSVTQPCAVFNRSVMAMSPWSTLWSSNELEDRSVVQFKMQGWRELEGVFVVWLKSPGISMDIFCPLTLVSS